LAGELPAKHLWHVQGLRYLYQDHLAAAMRCAHEAAGGGGAAAAVLCGLCMPIHDTCVVP
jgi:hypothetical protein